jgi:ribose 5-phosphate isomerase
MLKRVSHALWILLPHHNNNPDTKNMNAKITSSVRGFVEIGLFISFSARTLVAYSSITFWLIIQAAPSSAFASLHK